MSIGFWFGLLIGGPFVTMYFTFSDRMLGTFPIPVVSEIGEIIDKKTRIILRIITGTLAGLVTGLPYIIFAYLPNNVITPYIFARFSMAYYTSTWSLQILKGYSIGVLITTILEFFSE